MKLVLPNRPYKELIYGKDDDTTGTAIEKIVPNQKIILEPKPSAVD